MPNKPTNYPTKNTKVANEVNLNPLKLNKVPNPPSSFWKLVGPSFIFVGLALGSGELILWPYLVANWGMGIMWGAFLGITMQFFLNMEIERYALANGESIFVGFARIFRNIANWFVLSTVVAWSWPGFASTSANILTYFNINMTTGIAIGLLLLAGTILTVGSSVYKTVESIEKVLILIAIPSIIFIAFTTINLNALQSLFQGLVGIGDGYFLFPKSSEFPFASFLGAFAYAGAGGNLLLAQSFYIKEKGYGMGRYAAKISGLIQGNPKDMEIEGSTFKPSEPEFQKFDRWWNFANKEHLLIFWFLGLLTMLLLATISYATVYELKPDKSIQGLGFLFFQAETINNTVFSGLGSFLLLITALMLFSTQLTVVDASGRIIAENIAILRRKTLHVQNTAKIYYIAIWTIISFGILTLLFGLKEPTFLLILGAVINAVCMAVFSGLLIKTNVMLLHKRIQPTLWRKIIIYITFAVFSLFSGYVILEKLGII